MDSTRKSRSVTSIACSLASIAAQLIGLSMAAKGMVAAARHQVVPEAIPTLAGWSSSAAMLLALAAAFLAALALARESGRLPAVAVCLAAAAFLFSLLIV